MNNREMSAGTAAQQSTTDEVNNVTPQLQQCNVVGSFSLRKGLKRKPHDLSVVSLICITVDRLLSDRAIHISELDKFCQAILNIKNKPELYLTYKKLMQDALEIMIEYGTISGITEDGIIIEAKSAMTRSEAFKDSLNEKFKSSVLKLID